MGFRFRRSIRIAPGFRINLSKKGASLSVGRKGLTTNLSERGVRETIGIPGTGMSYTTSSRRSLGKQTKPAGLGDLLALGIFAFIVLMIVVAACGGFKS